jgi:MSHA biogenesis protein MshE
MARPGKFRLGEVLLNAGLITPAQLEAALTSKGTSTRRLGKILVEMNYVTEEQISKALATQLNIDFVDLKSYEIDYGAFFKLNESQARRARSVVIKETTKGYVVAMADPFDLNIYDDLVKILKKDLVLVCVTEESLFMVIDKNYRQKDNLQNIAKELEQDMVSVVGIDLQELTVEDAPVIKLLKGVFEDAVRSNASDIHIEPQKDNAMIRFRIDGVLHLHTRINSKICPPLISRLKIISNLDIAEKRMPQDGKFQIDVNNAHYDVRLSVLPENFGEGAVMRLLNQNSAMLEVDKIGMPIEISEPFKRIIHGNEGMILVVGPTGSGKTTTLYSALASIKNVEKKIITIEDPIEYQMSFINQVAVNDKIDLTFSKVLRSVLRQDPDVIMIGEIRDTETAQIALRSAITGHLILSTLHTKDTISTPARLIDIGVPNYMVATALQGVISQRLIRLNCKGCLADYEPTGKDLIWLEKEFGDKLKEVSFKHSTGCNVCGKTGFSGRTGVYEFLEIDDELSYLIHEGNLPKFSMVAKKKLEGRTMIDGIRKLLMDGKISLQEVQRVGF